jgi:ADP-heptose:LPS heptosyltransferase
LLRQSCDQVSVNPERPLDASRPVAFFVNGCGDHILVLPALRALASLFPGRLTLICEKGARNLYFSDVDLQSVIAVTFHSEEGGHGFDAKKVARAVGHCDLFLSLVPWYGRSLRQLLQLLASKSSIGFRGDFEGTILNTVEHAADRAFEIPRRLDPGLRLRDYCGPPSFPPPAKRLARQLRSLFPSTMRVLAVHSETQAGKMWPGDRFATVLDRFLEDRPNFVVFVVDKEPPAFDRGRHGDRVIAFPNASLDVAFCLVSQADYFLGIDSCMLHVADLCGVPGVGLFGPTSSAEFGFRVSRSVHVCGPGSMRLIRVEDVYRALESLVGSNTPANGERSSEQSCLE